MNPIVFAIVVVVVLGLAGGVILVLASKFMAVYEDPRIAQVTECLAGANCGGCGYAGCADYAKAIVENGAPTFKCAPGGDKTADAINTIMGNATDDRPSLRATVICAGGENCGKRFDYQGIQTCAAAASIAGGPSACAYGCLGLGDCTRACKFDAIHVINGVAVVDRKKCTGCTACTVVCPRHVIQMKPIAPQPAVMCSNKDKGALVNKTCKVGCIACGLCVRNCPNQAIFLKDNVAVIDYTKCNGCGTCVSKCPKKAIQWVEGTPRPIDAPVPAHEALKTRVSFSSGSVGRGLDPSAEPDGSHHTARAAAITPHSCRHVGAGYAWPSAYKANAISPESCGPHMCGPYLSTVFKNFIKLFLKIPRQIPKTMLYCVQNNNSGIFREVYTYGNHQRYFVCRRQRPPC